MMKYSSQGQATRVSRELKNSLSAPPEHSVPPAKGKSEAETYKKKESEVGLKSEEGEHEKVNEGLFLSAPCTFSKSE